MIRLRDILAMDIFRNFKIIAGKNGSDREVKTVSVMDAPDIYKWMKGGEFLITSGYVVKDQPEYLAFLIENLDKHGACALGIKLDRFIYEYPQDAIEKANKLNFPIIAIPFEFAFADVINPVLQEVINHQSRILQYSERVHQACTKMVLEDEDISTILSFLEEHIHQEAAFVDTCFDKTYYTKDTAQGGIEETGRYRIHINEEEYGYLVFGSKWNDYDESFRDYYQIAIEQAGTILILKLQKKLTARQIEAGYREQFVQDMLTRNISSKEEIINRAMIYNWDFYLGGVVFIVDIDHFKKQYLKHLDENVNRRMMEMMTRVLLISKQRVGQEYAHYVYSKLSDQIVFIITEKYKDEETFRGNLKKLAKEIKDEIARVIPFTATIGIGNYRKDISQIHDSWEEARKAIEIIRSMEREDTVVFYDELGIFKLLSLVSHSAEAKEFEKQYIEKICTYDRKHHTDMMDTFIALVTNGWNLKVTSEKLFIHYNSMKYRYRKLGMILELDLQDQEERLNLELALKLYQMHEK